MNGMEVATAVNCGAPVVYVIMNNAKLGLVHDLQTFVLGDKTVATRFRRIDAAMVGQGLGAVGHRVTQPGELRSLLPEVIASGQTTVIDCLIDPAEVPPLAPFVEGTKRFVQRLDFA
jgi:acetolactate synthase-1/2/3 large subunit